MESGLVGLQAGVVVQVTMEGTNAPVTPLGSPVTDKVVVSGNGFPLVVRVIV